MKLPTRSKFIVLAWIVIFTVSLLIVHNTPTTGWEASIYTSTPGIYWCSLLLGYIIGTYLIVRNIFIPHPNTSEKKLGFFVLSLNSLSFVSLWIIRGYFVLNMMGDSGTHLGRLVGTVASGFVGDSYYPLGYAALALDQLVFGITSLDIFAYYPIFIYCAFIIGIYLLTKHLSNNDTVATISTIIALYLPFGSGPYLGAAAQYVHHTYQAELLLPLIFYFILKTSETSNRKRYFILSLIGIILSVFYHPIAGMIVGLFIGSCLAYTIFSSAKSKSNATPKIWNLVLLLVVLIICYIFFLWKYFTDDIVEGITSIFQNIFTESISESTSSSIVSTLNMGLGAGYGVETILQIFGIELILLLFAGAAVIHILHPKTRPNANNMMILWLFFSIMSALLCVSIMISSFMVGIGRLSTLIQIITIIFSGYAIHEIMKRSCSRFNKKYISRYLHVVLSIILVIICILSVYSFYPSPYTFTNTPQTEATEYYAAETLLPLIEHGYPVEMPVLPFALYRYVDIFYTQNTGTKIIGTTIGGSEHSVNMGYDAIKPLPSAPNHFNYHTQENYRNETSELSYLIVTDKAKRYYIEEYGESMGKSLQERFFTDIDFKHVEGDSSLNRVYSNYAFTLYFTSML